MARAWCSPISPLARHVTDHTISDALDRAERGVSEIAHDAYLKADKALDVVIEETCTLTFFGLSRISDSAARKFVELGIRTRPHVGYPETAGKRAAFWVGLGFGAAALAYRFGALDAVVRRWAQRAWSAKLGTRVTIRSVALSLVGGRLDLADLRVDGWDEETSMPALTVGRITVAWSSSVASALFRPERRAPARLDLVEVCDVDLRLFRESDGALNWASANAIVRRRRTAEVLDHDTTSSSETSDAESDPPLSRFLLPLEDSSDESDEDAERRRDRPPTEYGARWWRRRDVVAIAETCGASYAATKSALERGARRIAPEAAKAAAASASDALDRARLRARKRADAFERWACDHARDVLRHVVVNLAHNLAAKAHAPPRAVRSALDASDDSSDSDADAHDAEVAAADAAPRRTYVIGRVGVRDFTLELYDCPVTLDRAYDAGPEKGDFNSSVSRSYVSQKKHAHFKTLRRDDHSSKDEPI